MSLEDTLVGLLATHGYTLDAGQQAAAQALIELDREWQEYKEARRNRVLRMVVRPHVPSGVYLWGGVGRGKSLLMDAFYTASPLTRRTRLHFHEFMRSVHAQLDDVRGQADPLDEVARRIARRFRLICFDEFHVNDIADAMILGRLLGNLIRLGVGFVMTSNYPPSGLYPEGLQRDRFLPTIALIEHHFKVVEIRPGPDWRQTALDKVKVYRIPADEAAEREMNQVFDSLVNSADDEPVVQIEARAIRCRRRAGSVIWFDFDVLCGGPRSQNDYLEIASRYNTVMLSGIPVMSAGQSSPARRFTWLIDVLYDRRIKLICTAAAEPDALYRAGALAGEFVRTASRLVEMQTREYLETAPRAAGETA